MSNKSLFALFALALAWSGLASAQAVYTVECAVPACKPFGQGNTYVQQLAVNLAASHNAPVGSSIVVAFFPIGGNCEERDLEWEVNHVPTTSIAHLTFEEGYCSVRDPRL